VPELTGPTKTAMLLQETSATTRAATLNYATWICGSGYRQLPHCLLQTPSVLVININLIFW